MGQIYRLLKQPMEQPKGFRNSDSDFETNTWSIGIIVSV